MKLMVINGSVREGRVSEKVQAWISEILQGEADLEVDVVDLKEVVLPFYDEPTPPSVPGFAYKNPKGAEWAKRVGAAEAFLLITPEYNHGPTAVLKNAVDWVFEEWRYKPVGFVSYGGAAAGTRAVQQLKLNLLNVDCYPVRNNVHIPLWGGGMDDNGRPQAFFDDLLRKVIVALRDLQSRLKT